MNSLNESGVLVSTDRNLLDLELITDFITHSYWGKDYSPEQIKKSVEESLCFGLYKNSTQIGFARVTIDKAFAAWLHDVFIVPDYQKFGYGKYFMEEILNHEQVRNVERWSLQTNDAHQFYAKFGFTRVEQSERLMQKKII